MITVSSETLAEEMISMTPGGVSSPVRRFDPYPLYMDSASGCNIRDVDGNEYLDLCMAYGPLILGHADPYVIGKVSETIGKGTVFGTPSIPEVHLIRTIMKRIPCAEMVRLVNSGTEATMHAIRLARGYTSRDKIIKIRGGFHGSHDSVLVASERYDMPGIPGTKGVPGSTAANTYSVDFNDAGQMEELLSKEDTAAVIMEPVMGNVGPVLPEKGYLEKVRKLTEAYGTVLIFDEVITGFRSSEGGAQKTFGVTPDICTLGKIIGGGFPIGAMAGRTEIMNSLSPSGGVYQAGTFSGNPVSAAAGTAAVERMSGRYEDLACITRKAVRSMRDSMEDRKIHGCVVSESSMFQVFFGIDEPHNADQALKADRKMFDGMFRKMLSEGIYLPPSPFEVNFLSAAHTDESMQRFTESFDSYLRGVSG